MSYTVELPTRRATIHLARRLAPALRPGDLVVLSGNLGAGKTFFTRALGRALGLGASIPVTSPTFTLIHELETKPAIAHADLYRLESATAVRELGLDAMRDDGYVVLVEWGEPFIDVLGGDALILEFVVDPGTGRRAALRSTGARSAAILDALALSRRP